jgi:hypothetical protein
MKLLKKLAKPATLGNCMSNNTIFCLYTGAGDCSLTFRRPRNQSVAEKDTITRGRTAGIGIASPISIRISCKRVNRTSANLKTVGQGTLHITQDAFQKGQVRLPRIMHEKTDLLNSISKIRTSPSEILESTS